MPAAKGSARTPLGTKDNTAVSDDLSNNRDAKDNIDMNMMKCILHKFAQPEIKRKLEDQKIEDEKHI